MASHSHSIAIVALALIVGGIWWVLPRAERGNSGVQDSDGPHLPAVRTGVAVEAGTGEHRGDGVASDASSTSVPHSAEPKEFSDLTEHEQALSRELEYVVSRTVDTTFDRGKYNVQAVRCRGQNCEVRFAFFKPPSVAERSTVLRSLYRDLSVASFVHPDTGAKLTLNSLELRQGSGEDAAITTLLKFANQ